MGGPVMKELINSRDRLITVLAADYTALALGLGETKAGMISLAFSSASAREASSGARAMGHAAGELGFDGQGLDEEMARVCGMSALAWSKRRDFPFRYVDVMGREGEEGLQEGIFFARGDFRNGRPSLRACADQIKLILEMYGISSVMASSEIWVESRAESLNAPSKHPMWAEWTHSAYLRAAERLAAGRPPG